MTVPEAEAEADDLDGDDRVAALTICGFWDWTSDEDDED